MAMENVKKYQAPSLLLVRLVCLLPALYFLMGVVYAVFDFDEFGSAPLQFIRYLLVPSLLTATFLILPQLVNSMRALAIGINAVIVIIGLLAAESIFTMAKIRMLEELAAGASADSITTKYDGIPAMVTPRFVNAQLGITDLKNALLSGIPGSNTFLCSHDGVAISYTADRFGFNNPDFIYDSPIDNLIIGDSFIEGMCQPRGQDVASTIRQSLPATVALGMRGAGPLFELAVLGRYGPVLRPKRIVFAFFGGNDWENLENEGRPDNGLRQALDAATDFGSTVIDPDRLHAIRGVLQEAARLKIERTGFFGDYRLLRNLVALQGVSAVLGIFYPKVSLANPDYEASLEAAKRIAASWGGEIAVMYIPPVDRYIGLLPNGAAFDSTRDLVREATESVSVTFVDLIPVFSDIENPRSLYGPDAHLNAAGAKALEAPILGFLNR